MAVTAPDVAQWGKFTTPTGPELVLLDRVIAAVTAFVDRHYIISTPATADQQLAIIMAVTRLWKRRSTPEGIQQFGDAIALRISSIDPDVERLLDSKWGFA